MRRVVRIEWRGRGRWPWEGDAVLVLVRGETTVSFGAGPVLVVTLESVEMPLPFASEVGRILPEKVQPVDNQAINQ